MTISLHPGTASPSRPRRGPRPLAAALTGLLALILTLVSAPTAMADARVTLSPATADPDYATKIRVHGSGFQSVKNGFGGIYVLFGTVSGDWRPSQGGTSGVDYVYVQDAETKDNHGYQRFVAFPGDPTAYAANGGTLRADGTWDATLVVPGAVFPAKGRDGGVRQIDCRKVRCGVITIGAHGVVSPSNETFTPVDFAAPAHKAPAKKPAQPSPTKTKHAAAAPSAKASATPTSPQKAEATIAPTATTATADPTATVAADPAVSATSTSGVGRLVAIAAALVAVVLITILLLRRRRRTATSTTHPGEK